MAKIRITQYPVQLPAQVGALARGTFRRALRSHGIDFQERKHLLESLFTVTIQTSEEERTYQALVKRFQEALKDG